MKNRPRAAKKSATKAVGFVAVIGLPGVQVGTDVGGARHLRLSDRIWTFSQSADGDRVLRGLRDLHELAVGRLRHFSSWGAWAEEETHVVGIRQAKKPDGTIALCIGRDGLLSCRGEDAAEEALRVIGDLFIEWVGAAPPHERFDFDRADGPGAFGAGPVFAADGTPHVDAVMKIRAVLVAAGTAVADAARAVLDHWLVFARGTSEQQPAPSPILANAFGTLRASSEALARMPSTVISATASRPFTDSGLTRRAYDLVEALAEIAKSELGRTAGVARTCERHVGTLIECMNTMEEPAAERPIAEEIAMRLGEAFENVEWAAGGFRTFARERCGLS